MTDPDMCPAESLGNEIAREPPAETAFDVDWLNARSNNPANPLLKPRFARSLSRHPAATCPSTITPGIDGESLAKR